MINITINQSRVLSYFSSTRIGQKNYHRQRVIMEWVTTRIRYVILVYPFKHRSWEYTYYCIYHNIPFLFYFWIIIMSYNFTLYRYYYRNHLNLNSEYIWSLLILTHHLAFRNIIFHPPPYVDYFKYMKHTYYARDNRRCILSALSLLYLYLTLTHLYNYIFEFV